MELLIYYNLSDFKENYILEYERWNVPNYLEYLETMKSEYERLGELALNENELFVEHFTFNDIYPSIKPDQNLVKVFLDEFPEIPTDIPISEQFVKILEIDNNYIYQFLAINFDAILQFINGEIYKVSFLKTNPDNVEDYSGKNELTPKEKLIILDKLGIIDLLTTKLDYSDNATHLAEILGAITGIDNQKGTLTGYCNYLIRPDDFNKNSPYFSETTVKKAAQIYNTFKIKDKTD